MRRPSVLAVLAAILVCWAMVGRAQQQPEAPATQGGAEDLAKKLANPICETLGRACIVPVPIR